MPIPDQAPNVRRPTARMQVFDTVRDWIRDGALLPGEEVKDMEIANQLGVSRTPVREALQMLAQIGLVETAAGRYTRVTSADVTDAPRLYPLLGVVVGLATEQAVPRLTAHDFKSMRQSNAALIAAGYAGDSVGMRVADHDFHEVFVRVADNPYLTDIVRSLDIHVRRLETLYFQELKASQESGNEHAAILEAAERGDAVAAAALTRHNYERSGNALIQRVMELRLDTGAP